MKKVLRLGLAATLVLALVVLGSFSPTQAKGPPSKSTGTGLVSDNSFYRVRSDGGGLYDDGEACVSVIAMEPQGFYQLRTVSNSEVCNLNPVRFLNLDFGQSVADVDQDGTAEAVESIFSRFIAGEAFANNATSTSVDIHSLKTVYVDGEPDMTTQDTAWLLRYLNPADVILNPDGSRTITFLVGTEAQAELFEIVEIVHPKSGKVKTETISHGVFNMPFEVIAARK